MPSDLLPVPNAPSDLLPVPNRKQNNNIFVDDLKEDGKRPIPNPCRSFLEAFQPYPGIMDNIQRVGFTTPTPIQVGLTPNPTLIQVGLTPNPTPSR